ncbi:hypothetical protein PG993_009044 [Apiospora rasikravindrae]|uniref:Secreted protein n=1 Tax=Apiospora rasikravindrae TaxID=990691 RepID=A0ABR1SI88_9PEZI
MHLSSVVSLLLVAAPATLLASPMHMQDQQSQDNHAVAGRNKAITGQNDKQGQQFRDNQAAAGQNEQQDRMSKNNREMSQNNHAVAGQNQAVTGRKK